jgi:hypothetical protein
MCLEDESYLSGYLNYVIGCVLSINYSIDQRERIIVYLHIQHVHDKEKR